ncbi:HBR219Wp [Eremothecium sinecaudum]|uniref:HBR219Wp n=1 Tax=Eremothecium sinecaudum TaxID=45286 RepID=A0A125RE12_9SACH|nr:HBR219Wp [Eremothecium sinecaudum]AMD19120.1 HBR219Wp [Eremothecium sinecaudum]
MIFQNSADTPASVERTDDDGHEDLDAYLTPLQPQTILLKDGETTATMYPIRANPDILPLGLLAFLLDEINMEIEKGDSFPYYEPLDLDEFRKIWFNSHGIVCIMVLGEIPELDYSMELGEEYNRQHIEQLQKQGITTMRSTAQYMKRKLRRNLNLNIQWEKQCLGTFNLIPAYPGRSSHVVTGTFLVNAGIRGKGIGRTLVESFLGWAPQLGFTSCCFSLVYGTNVGIRRILESSNFKRIGKLPESGILKGYDSPIDSFIYGKEFTHVSKQIDAVNLARKDSTRAKYERLKFYLETGEYPASCSRNEKARLRVMSKTHSILNGKLMFKGREVVYDQQRQSEIAFETHSVDHQGINRVTSKVAERYHWKGIKQSVAQVISTCSTCQNNTGGAGNGMARAGIVVDATDPENQMHILVSNPNDEQVSSVAKHMANALQKDQQDNYREDRYRIQTPTRENEPRVKLYKAAAHIKRIRFGVEPGQERVAEKRVVSNEESMNSFKKYVEEQNQRSGKKRSLYSEISPELLHSDAPRPESEPGTVLVEGSTTDMVDDALLHLEDNVMAAVEAVHKEQEQRQLSQRTPAEEAKIPVRSDDDIENNPSFRSDDSQYY